MSEVSDQGTIADEPEFDPGEESDSVDRAFAGDLLDAASADGGVDPEGLFDTEVVGAGVEGDFDGAVGAAAYGVTADEPLESRLAALEKGLADQQKENKRLSDLIRKSVQPGHSGATMKVAGRVHLDSWAFPGDDDPGIVAFEGGVPQDRYGFRRLRLGAAGTLVQNLEYKIEMDFAVPSVPVVKDAYLGITDLPFLQKVLFGVQKRPYGLDHLNSSNANVFLERPFVVEAFNQDARRLGIVSYGVSEDESWNWRYGTYGLQDPQLLGSHIGDHYELEFAGRLANTIWYDESSDGRGYAHWAVSGTVADTDSRATPQSRFQTRPEARTTNRWLNTGNIAGSNSYELLGLEGVLNLGPFQVVGEYMQVWMQRQETVGPDLNFGGGYVYASYFLTGEHQPWSRSTGTLGQVKPFENFFLVDRCNGGIGSGWGAWQIAARYSYGDLTSEDVMGGVGESITLGLVWYWSPSARLQFNYLHGRIDDRGPVAGQTEGEYDIIGTRLMVFF